MNPRWVWRGLLALLAFVYLYFVPYYPSLNNPNENSRVYQIRAAVELHKLSINEQIKRYGWVNDLAVADGKYYAGKAPGTTFLGIPIYAALRAWERWRGHSPVTAFRLLYALRLAGTLLPTLVFLAWYRSFLRGVVKDDRVANALTILLALGSMLVSYALIYVNHSLTAATAFGAVIATQTAVSKREQVGRGRIPTASWLWLSVAGFLLALTATLDYALLPVALILLVWIPIRFGWSWPSTLGVWIGASLPSLWTSVYHTLCWGGPFKLSIDHLANAQFATIHSKGVFGIVGPSLDVLRAILISPSKGLLYFSPIFGLALLATAYASIRLRKRVDAVLSLVVVWLMVLYNCSLENWDGGWTVGPRYATVMVPFAIYALALSWTRLSLLARRLLLPIALGLGVLSVLVMTCTSVLFPHLPPDYKNPVYEIIWPLWRDAVVPYSFGLRWLSLSGRAAQIPFLLALAVLLLYLARLGSGWGVVHRSRWGAALSCVALLALVFGGLKLGTIPHTESAEVVESGMVWIRNAVWYPPLPQPYVPPPKRPPEVRLPGRLPGR